jgi:cation:H+ antiporter
MLWNICLLCLGVVLLYLGSEWMVKGAAGLALSYGIRPLVIGLTVVAFATSAPELLVSVIAAVKGSSGVSIGNILGSNVANIGLVLGLSALLRPMAVDARLVRRDIPFMLGVSGLLWLVCTDDRVGRIDGLLLLAGLGVFLWMGFRSGKSPEDPAEIAPGPGTGRLACLLLLVVGLLGLMFGANLIVNAAIVIARQLGLSEVFIGISIVAFGTSLPELATSVVAGIRGEYDISIGNIVGSNVFNVCMVMGTVGLFNPMRIDPKLLVFEFPAMMGISLLLLIFCRSGHRINRGEGLCFLLGFAGFILVSFAS